MRAAVLAFTRAVADNPNRIRSITRDHQKRIEKILLRRLRPLAFNSAQDTLAMITRTKAAQQLIETKDATSRFESAIVRWLREHALRRAVQITESLRKALANIIADGRAAGLGQREVGRNIREAAPDLSTNSANRIARTETHTGAQRAAFEAAKASTIDLAKEWASSEDDRTRKTHNDIDGTIHENLNELFLVGDSDMLYPGDENAEAKEVINCRCVALYHPIIDGEILM